MELEELEKQLETKIKKGEDMRGYQGLSTGQIDGKQKKFGKNKLSEKKGLPWYIVFLLRFTGAFNYLLWGGALLCFIGYGLQSDKSDKSNLFLGIVLILIIFITAVFSHL